MEKRHYSAMAFAAVCLMAVCSCVKEQLPTGGFDRGYIKPVVSFSGVTTKSSGISSEGRYMGSYAMEGVGFDSLYISVYEFDNDGLPYGLSEEEPQTKGRVTTNESINATGQQFTMNAWLESANRYTGSPAQLSDGRVYETADASDYHFMKNATATCDGSVWTLGCSSPANENWNIWRNNVPTNFWAMYPTSLSSDQGTIAMSWPVDNAGDGAQKTASFDYTLPAPRADSRDAEYQPDLCFAYSRKGWNESAPGNDNKVDIDFNHALSAVYFTTSGVLNSIAVNKIGFNNVPSTAHCEMTGNDGNPGTPDIKWNGQGVLKNYRQSYQSSDFVGGSKTMHFDNSSKVFMMIPDSLAKNGTKLWAEFQVKGVSVPQSVDISKFSDGTPVVWRPGKRYLYKLTFNGYDNFTFYFNETGNPTATARSYTDTTSESKDIPVVSAAVNADNAMVSDVDWYIKEVIRNNDTTTVNSTSFDSSVGNGFSATKIGNSLRVSADARTSVNRGNNAYWTNPDNENWAPADWSSKGVIDLSKTDFATDDVSKINTEDMTTANCYIIRHAGTYRIPLVYGNAIKDGITNTPSYKPTMAAGGNASYFLGQFKNSNNANITSPFIDSNSGFGAKKAFVLWQDEANIVHDVSLVNHDGSPSTSKPTISTTSNVRYLQFTINQEDICQNNALIAVTNSVGDVIWSWHIWVTNDPGLLKPAIPVKNQANNIYNFFPLPCLGWIEENAYPARDSIQIVLEQRRNGDVPKNTITLTVHQPDIYSGNPNGCYYQFGRKDPMCRKDSPAYNHSDRPFNMSGVGKVSLADAIMHPEVFYNYGSSSPCDWCSNSYYNLWSGGYCGTDLIESTQAGLSKTVYDPSPRGYMMPASNAFTGFTSTGSNTSTRSQFNVVDSSADSFTQNKGWNFYTVANGSSGTPAIFFPAAGLRSCNGGVRAVGGGCYWSAVPVSKHDGRLFYSHSGNISPVYLSFRSYGYSARPVQE